ncbi:MAG: UDP-3-O-(3-hydroxymyristoyl)glucosamine N-acyltransferase [Bacteroidetes bacterium]|nr:UDP-3-O-(3-hydroxymyristoyl)glucosamine N-acyltransferase [Bacteroidota bacterium]
MEFTAKDIASLLGGRVDGNPDAKVNKLAKIEDGESEALSFLANPKYTQYIYSTQSSIVIVKSDFEPEMPISATLIRVDDPYSAFAKLLEIYDSIQKSKVGVSAQAFVAANARIGKNVYIGEFSYVGDNAEIGDNAKIYPQSFIGDNVKVGANTTLYQGVKIYHDCNIGKDCMIHAGAVIGADGFGFAVQSDNNYKKVAQIGNVVIEDRVEIGANTTIDRATLGSTIIRQGVKLDNLIQVGHNVEIGENTVIAAQTGISGSTKIGRNCMIGGQVGIVGHIVIADEVKIGAQAGVGGSITKPGSVVLGAPAIDIGRFKRSIAVFNNLDKLSARVSDLERNMKNTMAEERK